MPLEECSFLVTIIPQATTTPRHLTLHEVIITGRTGRPVSQFHSPRARLLAPLHMPRQESARGSGDHSEEDQEAGPGPRGRSQSIEGDEEAILKEEDEPVQWRVLNPVIIR
jgi:hypothetical protein